MKKKILKHILILCIFLIPFSNVSAATWKYRFKRMPVSDVVSNIPSNTQMLISATGTCDNNSKGNHPGCMKLTKIGSKYTLTIHEVNSSGKYYHGYCLHAGKQIYNDATIASKNGFDELPDINGSILSDTKQKVLENIVASGYQNGEGKISNIIDGSYEALGTCKSADRCRKVLVTQILVWEVTSGARSNYCSDDCSSIADFKPNKSNPASSPYNQLIKKNTKLANYYMNVLKNAKKLDAKESIPAAFGKTYTLKWSDARNEYVSENINIEDYKITTGSTSTLFISSKSNQNTVQISSTNKITSKKTIKVKKVVGSTNSESLKFRWFRFKSDRYGGTIPAGVAQDVLLGDYSKEYQNEFYVQTESGNFKITKIDAETKKLLTGSKFKLYKCKNSTGSSCGTQELQKTIDLTNNAQYVQVEVNKSGRYLLEETVVPQGYSGLGQFMFDVDINTTTGEANITNIYGTDLANIEKIGNTLVKNSLVIGNKSKSFAISKIDGTSNTPIVGATFQIKDSKGNLVKFNDVSGKYVYSQTGTITDLVRTNTSKYEISSLPQGDYTIIETAVPYPYSMASSENNRKTQIRIGADSSLWIKSTSTNSYSKSTNATVTIKNFKTQAEIIKSGKKGEFLKGVIFELYDSKKENLIGLRNTADGVYEYAAGAQSCQLITNSSGKVIINYLPAGKYWVKEVVTVGDYVIDETVEWTQIEIVITKTYTRKVTKTIRNAKATFNFYKMDEDGNYLSDGKFKIQKYNDKTKKYEDATLLYIENEDAYTIDETGKSDIIVFTPKNGVVKFVEMEANTKYRIVEIEAPEGFILPELSETQAEIVINENGYAQGDSVIINKKITVGEGAQASAELIINISTGQTRIQYILIIAVLVTIITGLFIINRKIRKK